LHENAQELAEQNKLINFGYTAAMNQKVNMRRPINSAMQSQIQGLSEKYNKLADLNMKSRLQDLNYSLVEASAKAKVDKVEFEIR
jgi:hypothetical protein